MVSDPSKDSPLGDSDNVTYCSFNFPAVLLTLGPGGWPQLSETYSLLTKDGQFKVRRSLAFSLHEIAKILGTELTVAALLPTLEAFLKDLEEVKVGVITNLAKFYEVLSPSIREEYLYVLEDIRKDTNWRFRKLLAKYVLPSGFAFPLRSLANPLRL
jgi:serine/threonine-protein phosphatase 4 regulatory subunit 1